MPHEYSDAAKDLMLDAITPDLISIHTDDPGADGTSNEVNGAGSTGTYDRVNAVFDASSSGSRALNAAVDFVGPDNEDATWFAIWEEDGVSTGVDLFLGAGQITGDVAFNSIGEFSLADATLTISDGA